MNLFKMAPKLKELFKETKGEEIERRKKHHKPFKEARAVCARMRHDGRIVLRVV